MHLRAVLNMNCMEEFTSKSSNFLKDVSFHVSFHFLFHVLFHVKFGYIGCCDFSINDPQNTCLGLHNGENDSHKRQFLALGVCFQSWKLGNLSKKNFLSN